MAEEAKDFGAIGEEILFAARNELYMNLPYLDVAPVRPAVCTGG